MGLVRRPLQHTRHSGLDPGSQIFLRRLASGGFLLYISGSGWPRAIRCGVILCRRMDLADYQWFTSFCLDKLTHAIVRNQLISNKFHSTQHGGLIVSNCLNPAGVI